MKKKSYNIAVVGATGMVGEAMINILQEREFPMQELRPLASKRSTGKGVLFRGKEIPVQTLGPDSFSGIDIALFSAGAEVSRVYAPLAVKAGALVIDNTSAFRMHEDIPLVVPEVNPAAIERLSVRRIIANPNCSTIQMVVALQPLHKRAQIKRVVVSTYQSTSGAGREANVELEVQTKALLQGRREKSNVFPHQIAFNCLPHIDLFGDDDYTREELKVMRETKKIMEDNAIEVTATAVRVPVFCGHSEAVNVEFRHPISPDEAREILRSSPGIQVVDDPAKARYPLAIDAAGKDAVFVGRIRRDPTVEHGLALWIVSDNIRKGAALNSVQIAELALERGIL